MSGAIVREWHLTVAGLKRLSLKSFEGIAMGWHWASTLLQQGINHLWALIRKTWLRIKGLFGQDVAKDIRTINEELRKTNAELDRSLLTKLARNERQADAGLEAVAAELAGKLNATDEGTAAAIAAQRAELDKARQAWKTATQEARKTGEAAKEAAAQVATVDEAVAAVANVSGPGGPRSLFDARYAGQVFGGSDVQEDQLDKLTTIAGDMAKTRRVLERGVGIPVG